MPHEERDYCNWVTLPNPHNRLKRWPQVCFWQAFVLLSGIDWTGQYYRDGLVMLDVLEEYGLLTIKQKRCLQRQLRQTGVNDSSNGIIWWAMDFLVEVYGNQPPPVNHFWWYHPDYWQPQPWDDFRTSLQQEAKLPVQDKAE
ncbi:MAG: hypothetical protein Q9N68_04460 [Gammaproteobacteria bacterium]|nr:hypothetical protein [Gammaproteobacteria bacterium]